MPGKLGDTKLHSQPVGLVFYKAACLEIKIKWVKWLAYHCTMNWSKTLLVFITEPWQDDKLPTWKQSCFSIKKFTGGTREVAQHLKAFAAHAGSQSSTGFKWLAAAYNPASEDLVLSAGLHRHRHAFRLRGTRTHTCTHRRIFLRSTDEEERGPWEEVKEMLGKDKEWELSVTTQCTKMLLMKSSPLCANLKA